MVITAHGTITSTWTSPPEYWPDYQGPFVLADHITATLRYDSRASFGIVPVSGEVTGYYPANGRITTGSGWSHEAWSYFNVGASDMTFTGQWGDPRYSDSFPIFLYSAMLAFGDPYLAHPPYPLDASTFLGGTLTGAYGETPSQYSTFSARIDSITALATPIPASGWLFASALAGLAGLGRKSVRPPLGTSRSISSTRRRMRSCTSRTSCL